jgi:methylenetetrahydrofolate--tRNA-(uracil-5-)-methyltransferase
VSQMRASVSGGGIRDARQVNVSVVGGGLAGCEAAWALAESGVSVTLFEMRPELSSPAHETDRLAEIVCSNSFKSVDTSNAHGLLKAELRMLGSLLLTIADETRVPAGSALAVDRSLFSQRATELVTSHPNISVKREEITELISPAIIATGPLTSDHLAEVIRERLGVDSLTFFDSIAPILSAESLDMSVLYPLSRYGKGSGDDYLNAPLTEAQYRALVEALLAADQYVAHEFEKTPYFEGCLPVEELARRGPETLRFGPMKPVGLPDPSTGREPYAVVQLRREDKTGQMWNLVGFQTKMRQQDQGRVLRTIPGLGSADFLRFGSMHRNTYLNAPATLTTHLSTKHDDRLLFAGQLTGVEGYTESLGTGILAGHNMVRLLQGMAPKIPPPETMLGGLLRYVSEADSDNFQPMNANFGLLPPLEVRVRKKRERKERMAERALESMRDFVDEFLGSEA